MVRSIHVMTGATSGLGLQTARLLARDSDTLIIAGARTPEAAAASRNAVPPDRLVLLTLDTSSLASVRRFAAEVRERLGGERITSILCIAGLQILGPQEMTADGVDETFATNHLGHFALVENLRDRLAPGGLVVTIGSGTHNPDDPIAKRFGFRGAEFADAHSVALGRIKGERSETEAGIDRYATSKLCTILYTLDEGARSDDARFVCFDPGLMPGTGLARDRSAAQRLGWRYVMPLLSSFIPGISSAERSARAIVDRIMRADPPVPSGSYIDFNGRPAPRSPASEDPELAGALRHECEMLVKPDRASDVTAAAAPSAPGSAG